jgi:hypothetical protein
MLIINGTEICYMVGTATNKRIRFNRTERKFSDYFLA